MSVRLNNVLALGATAFIAVACSPWVVGQQTRLTLSSGIAFLGGAVPLTLTVASDSGVQATALEWKLSYPAASVSGVTLSAGASSNAAGKSLECIPSGAIQTTCVLYSLDGSVIQNGAVATARLQVQPSLSGTVIPITVSAVAVSDKNGSEIPSSATNGTVTVTAVPVALHAVSCGPTSVIGPAASVCTVTLSGAASNATAVTLASNSSVVSLPIAVIVPAGAQSAQVNASTGVVATTHNVVVTASVGGASVATTLQVTAPTQVTQPVGTFTLSGNVGGSPAGANAVVTLISSTGIKTTVSTDTQGGYKIPGLASGTYVALPTKAGVAFTPVNRVVTVGKANVTGVNFAVQVLPTGKLSTDVQVSADESTASSTVSSPAFSTGTSQQLLLAFIATDNLSSTNTSVSSVSGAGLAWTLVVRTNNQQGTSEIWRALAPTVLSNVSVTAQLSESVVSSMTIKSFAGVNTSGTGGSGAIGAIGSGHDSSGEPSAALTTQANNSLVVGVGNDFDNALGRAPAAGQQLLHQSFSPSGDTYWVQSLSSVVPLKGTNVVVRDLAPTSDQYNLSICEVVPAGGN